MINKIIQGDCLEVLRDTPNKTVDLIVIDPPYNIGKDRRWDKYETVDAYVEFMGEVFTECNRVLRDNGSFYWFHNDMTQIRRLMDELDGRTSFEYKQLIVWNKRFEGAKLKEYLDGHVAVKGLRNFKLMAEYCLFYVKEDKCNLIEEARRRSGLTQNDVDVAIGRVRKKNPNRGTELCRRWEEGNSIPSREDFEKLKNVIDIDASYDNLVESYHDARYTFNNQRTHHSVWNYEVTPKQGHITPKPVDLIENIIRHSSNEGDVVLDCFLGSGTTAVASINTGRNFIGIEKESEYVEIARKRVVEALEARERR